MRMPIELKPETRKQVLASIKRYADEHLDIDMGDLKADGLLEFILQEIGPVIYNTAIADAQSYLHERVIDLEAVCFQKELGYWPARDAARRSS